MEEKWNEYRQKLFTCLANEDAPCTSGCPFHRDIRSWIEKVQEGRFDAACRKLMNETGFPGIAAQICTAPCGESCLMKNHGGAVDLKLLEQAVVKYASVKPNRYNMPAKKERVAVVGGGMSGLACALRLCNRKYGVTVFEKSDRLGGTALQLMDPEEVFREIETQFQFEVCEFRLFSEVRRAEDLLAQGFDAVYAAAGKDSSVVVPEMVPGDGGPYPTVREGIFAGGQMCGANPAEAMAQGLRAAALIESYLKTGVMRGAKPAAVSRLRLKEETITDVQRILPAEENGYSAREAAEEASRCIRCRCDACLKGCGIMKTYSKTPFRIAEEVDGTLHPGSLGGEMTLAMRFLSSCDQCGYCVDVCPQKINIGEFLLESRRLLQEKGKLPWAFFDYWVKEMEFSCRDAGLYLAENTAGSGYLYFPGCQMGGSDPEYVFRSYEAIKKIKAGTGLLLGCCGAPALWAGQEKLFQETLGHLRDVWEDAGRPVFILACPTCEKMFRRWLPEIPVRSLFVLLCEGGFVPERKGSGMEYAVFDPCAARENNELRESIRELLRRGEIPFRETEETALCCTYGGNSAIANPGYTKQMIRERSEKSSLPYLTYCVNCRDTFASRGKPAWHIFDFLFDINAGERNSPGATGRRKGKRTVYAAYTGRTMESKTRLIIGEEVQKKLDGDYLLAEDVEKVIEEAERTGKKIRDEERNLYICYGKMGHMTCWAEYRTEGQKIILCSVYAHRMSIAES